MMRNLKGWAALALSAAMVVSMGACGTSDKTDSQASDDSNSSSTTGYDVSGVKKDEKIAKMLPDYVTKDGKLTIGMDTSYAPAEFLAADGKTPVGFDVDIAKALAGVFGLEADPETANFDSIIPAVGAKYDIGISSFTVTKERLEAVDFVSHFNAGSAWAVKKGNPNKVDTSDLCGKKVAVQTATMQETAANKMAKQCKADGKAEMDVISSKLQTEVPAAAAAATTVVNAPVAGHVIALDETGDPVFASRALGEGVGIQPTDSEVVAPVSGVLQTVAETGHAFGIKTDDGVEVLVHVGIDTVKMNGEGFAVKVKADERVNAGDPLVSVDFAKVKDAGYSTTTLMTVLNTAALTSVTPKTYSRRSPNR